MAEKVKKPREVATADLVQQYEGKLALLQTWQSLRAETQLQVLGNFAFPNPLKENGKRYSPLAIRAAGFALRNLGDFDAWIVGQPFIYHRSQVLDFIAFENLDLPHRLLPWPLG